MPRTYLKAGWEEKEQKTGGKKMYGLSLLSLPEKGIDYPSTRIICSSANRTEAADQSGSNLTNDIWGKINREPVSIAGF